MYVNIGSIIRIVEYLTIFSRNASSAMYFFCEAFPFESAKTKKLKRYTDVTDIRDECKVKNLRGDSSLM